MTPPELVVFPVALVALVALLGVELLEFVALDEFDGATEMPFDVELFDPFAEPFPPFDPFVDPLAELLSVVRPLPPLPTASEFDSLAPAGPDACEDEVDDDPLSTTPAPDDSGGSLVGVTFDVGR